jgi:heme exporter protein A
LTGSPGVAPGADFQFDRVSIENVSRNYGRRRALWHVTLECRASEILGLLGPNGAGKSTLLGIMATLIAPSSGRVVYGSAAAHEAGPKLRRQIGTLGHESLLYPELTARENLEFFGRLYGMDDAVDRAAHALATAGLAARADEPISRFSRGMRQRVALERALIHDPRLILLDEPFTGLDDPSLEALSQRLTMLRDSGRVVVMATHDLDRMDGLLDRGAIFKDGRLVSIDGPSGCWRTLYRDRLGAGT